MVLRILYQSHWPEGIVLRKAVTSPLVRVEVVDAQV